MSLYSFENKNHELVDLTKPIIVSMESMAPLKEANVISDDGMKWHIPLMYFDEISRNNNLYPMTDTKKSVKESVFINENLRNRTLFGELEHPPANSDMSRFMFIEPTRYAWNITTIEDKGDRYEGDVYLCAPLGTSIVLPNVKSLGCNYAASCRIATPNYVIKEMNGKKVYVKKYKMYPVTWDLVSIPGIPGCRLVKDGQYRPDTPGNPNPGSSSESFGSMVAEFSNPADEIIKMLSSEESGKIIQDIYGIDYKTTKAVLTKDNKVRMSCEDGSSATVALNSYLLSSILG